MKINIRIEEKSETIIFMLPKIFDLPKSRISPQSKRYFSLEMICTPKWYGL